MSQQRDAVIVGAVRSPVGIGKPGKGDFAGIHPVDLSAMVLTGLVNRVGVEATDVDDVIWGCVSQVGEQSANVARNAATFWEYSSLNRFDSAAVVDTTAATRLAASASAFANDVWKSAVRVFTDVSSSAERASASANARRNEANSVSYFCWRERNVSACAS